MDLPRFLCLIMLKNELRFSSSGEKRLAALTEKSFEGDGLNVRGVNKL